MKRTHFAAVAFLVGSAALGQSGCSAIRTTPMTRHENEELTVDPCDNLKGVPVMLKVPSHLEVEIVEATYYDFSNETLTPHFAGSPARRVSANLCYTEKMILVDPVRPISGTGAYGFSFGQPTAPTDANQGNGYLNGFSYSITDTTIKDTANLIATVAPLLGKAKAAGDTPSPVADKLIRLERTIALCRFDLASPTFQKDVQDFLDLHTLFH